MVGRRARQKYCSLACRPKPVPPVPARTIPDQVCPRCERTFRPKRNPQKFCSLKCAPTPYSGNAKNKRPDKVCPTCSTSFHPGRADQQFCSRPCIPREAFINSPERAGQPVPSRRCTRHDPNDRVPSKGGTATECGGCKRERADRSREATRKRNEERRILAEAAKIKADAEWDALFRAHGLVP